MRSGAASSTAGPRYPLTGCRGCSQKEKPSSTGAHPLPSARRDHEFARPVEQGPPGPAYRGAKGFCSSRVRTISSDSPGHDGKTAGSELGYGASSILAGYVNAPALRRTTHCGGPPRDHVASRSPSGREALALEASEEVDIGQQSDDRLACEWSRTSSAVRSRSGGSGGGTNAAYPSLARTMCWRCDSSKRWVRTDTYLPACRPSDTYCGSCITGGGHVELLTTADRS